MEQFYDSVILFGICQKINYLHGNLQLFWTLQQRLAICVCCIDAGRIANVNLFIILQKHIIAGMTAGAVKG